MHTLESDKNPAAGQRPLWSGLLLGFLLMVFAAAFVYVAYLFLAWGQAAVAQTPDMPPLSLPRLVRSASDGSSELAEAVGQFFQPGGQGQQDAQAASVGRTTVLLLGVDARPGWQVVRTDTIIVLTLDPQSGSAGMLSIPRDLKVTAPVLNTEMKINTVYPSGEAIGYSGGGAALLSDTISDLIGYPIDYYAIVNFDGFEQIIDLIGGVEIDVPSEIYDDKYPDDNLGYEAPLHFLPGKQPMDGERALRYARTRNADNDYMRAARQQQVIMAIKDKITRPGVMASLLPRLPGLAIALGNSVETDMPMDKAITLARVLDSIDLQNITRVVIDTKMGTVDQQYPGLGYVLIPDMNKLRAAADAIFADAPVGPTQEEAARQVIQSEAARVMVLNGTQEMGLASKTQAVLVTNGFNVVNVGNAERADYAETWLVSHGDTAPATLQALVEWFQIPPDRIRSEPPSDQLDITLIIGSDQVQPAAQP